MIYDNLRVTGAHDTVHGYADLFSITLRNDDVQVLYEIKLRISESDQLQTILELYDLEIHQKISMPDYQKLKPTVKRNIDQKLRLRNFDARNERIETGAAVTNRRGQRARSLTDLLTAIAALLARRQPHNAPLLHSARTVHEVITDEYGILESVNYELGTYTMGEWVQLFELRFSL